MAFERSHFIDVCLLETGFCYHPPGQSPPGWPLLGAPVEEIGSRRCACLPKGPPDRVNSATLGKFTRPSLRQPFQQPLADARDLRFFLFQ